ncbi:MULTISPECIES: DUF4179 domain-containing protein [Pontibacillus]|uniref:DUF4179 domain-containing protein n=1 Tax=Pontibacillus chungwhensis TaxID=265426 RepID=A0ABY8V383_9BACI|nr:MULTISPECIES: DUF4179 domain-containing protein [Pontibacillus]MCD5322431.1 DUF4179 domain-containing protein [Pontibacillus sp. HN14]WIF99717.1 DUF4179 domain-containing protein [Pontibacillus chungwhensis]
MEKWEHLLDEEVNKELPESVEKRMESTLKSLPNKKTGKKKWLYGITAAVVATGILINSSSVSTTIADSLKDVPFVGSVMEKVGGLGEKSGQQGGLTVSTGEQVNIGDQTIIFTETLYDGNSIYISYLNMSDHLNKLVLPGMPDVLVDGEPLDNYGIGAGGQKIEEGVYGETMSIRTQEELPHEFLLTLSGEANGSEWQVDLPVIKKGNSKVMPINKSFKSGEDHIHYSTVSFTSTSTRIQFQMLTPEDSKIIQNNQHLDFVVEDENGKVLRGIGASSHSIGSEDGKVSGKYTVDLEPYREQLPETLSIRPYLMEIPTSEEAVEPVVFRSKKWTGEPVTLSQGEMGQLNVDSVEREGENVTITYTVKGEDEATQASTFWITDGDGNRYEHDRVERRIDHHTFKQTYYNFPVEKDIHLHTTEMDAHHYLSDFGLTIDLEYGEGDR